MGDKKQTDAFDNMGFGPGVFAGPHPAWGQGFSYGADPRGYDSGNKNEPPMQGVPHPHAYWPPYPNGAPPWAVFGPPPPDPGYGPGYGIPPHIMAAMAAMQAGQPGYDGMNGASANSDDFKGMHGLLDALTKGNNPVASLARMLDVNSGDFWKGAAVGAALVLVLNNDDIKEQLKTMFGGLMPGSAHMDPDAETEEPEA